MDSRLHHNAGSRGTLVQCHCGVWRNAAQMPKHMGKHNPEHHEMIKEEMDIARDRVGRAKKQRVLRSWF